MPLDPPAAPPATPAPVVIIAVVAAAFIIPVLVGVATWLAFLALGMQRAATWGVAAAVLNFVPYLGSLALSGGAALFGFLQFGTLGGALLPSLVSLAIHTLSGNLLTPWWMGRASRMNPVVIFLGVLAWGWRWGLWGLLLGAPLLMAASELPAFGLPFRGLRE